MAITIRKVLKWLGLLLVMAFLAFIVLARTDRLPYSYRIVSSYSMVPTFTKGDVLLLHRGDYEVGQPVNFTTTYGANVTHRLEAINDDDTVTTKGDGDQGIDPWRTPVENVYGGVVATWRGGMYIIGFILVSMLIVVIASLFWPSDKEGQTTAAVDHEPAAAS